MFHPKKMGCKKAGYHRGKVRGGFCSSTALAPGAGMGNRTRNGLGLQQGTLRLSPCSWHSNERTLFPKGETSGFAEFLHQAWVTFPTLHYFLPLLVNTLIRRGCWGGFLGRQRGHPMPTGGSVQGAGARLQVTLQ